MVFVISYLHQKEREEDELKGWCILSYCRIKRWCDASFVNLLHMFSYSGHYWSHEMFSCLWNFGFVIFPYINLVILLIFIAFVLFRLQIDWMLWSTMGLFKASRNAALLQLFIVVCSVFQCSAVKVDADLNTTLIVNASDATGRPIPETLFGIFFEVRLNLQLAIDTFFLSNPFWIAFYPENLLTGWGFP